ncbi:MAG TPA: hypothetical protein VKT78_15515 [Fimbriimonadaceae bacterium]|nr:hypothetical protein [Fimbriimonadaceae bacterium]
MELKQISKDAIAHALGLGERYRLLNEPDQAASICRDILAVDPGNQDATRMLLLALTDQFGRKRGVNLSECETLAQGMKNEYDRSYYSGVAYERWARALLQEPTPKHVVGEWLRKALECYHDAESVREAGNDDSLLRWNTIVRLMQRFPDLQAESSAHEHHFGD